MFLLDTTVLSELRKRDRDPAVVRWIEAQRASDLFLSVVSIGEIERGIARQKAADAELAERLSVWLDRLLHLYSDRLLPVDLNVSRRWGRLSANVGHNGADLLIAATALEHGLSVATRNVRHFEPTGVGTINPFSKSSR